MCVLRMPKVVSRFLGKPIVRICICDAHKYLRKEESYRRSILRTEYVLFHSFCSLLSVNQALRRICEVACWSAWEGPIACVTCVECSYDACSRASIHGWREREGGERSYRWARTRAEIQCRSIHRVSYAWQHDNDIPRAYPWSNIEFFITRRRGIHVRIETFLIKKYRHVASRESNNMNID